jgi:hypothetical protein
MALAQQSESATIRATAADEKLRVLERELEALRARVAAAKREPLGWD